MRPSNSQNYPQFENSDKQEAARFLCCDINARPVIRGIDDPERLDAWTKVAKELEIEGRQRRALRQRWQALNTTDEDVQFSPASEMDTGADAAFADGGSVVEASGSDSDDEQSVTEYADPAEQESKYQDACAVAKMFDDTEQIRERLQEEWARDERRPHVVDALEDRLSEVTA